ncbi:hypothetical protein NIES2109_64030 (plasmid) [Nostoc sp. HK-01]|nr:hypothetical protein NIES2109_64030 [Nostoc sp. HK-01]
MTYISLSTVDEIYSCCSSIKIYKNQLEHHKFRIFCLSLKKFEQSLGENAAEDYWKDFLRPLRQYRFKLCAAPLPFNHPIACQPGTIKFLEKHLKSCKFIYPDFDSPANKIFNCLVDLSICDDNPLLDFLEKNYPNDSLLLKESYLISAVENILFTSHKLKNNTILTPSHLRTNSCYKRLVVIGATLWFPDYIFTAPRTYEIDIVQYSWIKDKWQPKPVFIASPDNVIQSNIVYLPICNTEEINTKNTDIAQEDYLHPDEIILPSTNTNWIQIGKKISTFSSYIDNEESIEARLFLLEGEIAVFLDANTKALVIDLVENGESQVKRELVTDIETGMFIILRTNGGGDYIIPLANYILGEKAQYFRELQRLWKTRLKNKVSSSSLQDVSWRLLNLGSKLAKHEQNIRTWMSSRNIKPKDEKDFNAILTFVGLADRLEEFHEAAEEIYRAHYQAGKHIRKLLMNKVRTSNLQKLEQIGKMDFELSEADGGSMTAFRVLDIHREIIMLPFSKIAHPFQLDGEFAND